MAGRSSRSIYVGNLPLDVKEREIEDIFYKYGRIMDIELKIPQRPPGYCFVEFEDSLGAEDAIRYRDGYDFDGCRLRVELANGGRGSRPSTLDRRGGYRGRGGGNFGPSRRSDYRVMVSGLPSGASWQDLKDHMRKAGDVCYAEVNRARDGAVGIVDYTSYDDMKYAIRKLDDTEFKNSFGKGYIRVKSFDGSRSPSRSRSPRRNRSKSPRYRSISRSLSRSRSKSPANRSKSPPNISKSRSKSPAKRSRSPLKRSRTVSRSPARRSRSPAKRSRSPSKRSRSPAKRSRSPAKRSRSPAKRSRSPAKRSRTISKSPAKMSRSKSRSRSPSPF